MRKRLTQKQEMFCVKYFETGKVAQSAIAAGYSPRSADITGSVNLRIPLIAARIQELRQRVEDDAVMKVLERKRKLSEIGRGRITDYLADSGVGFNVGPGSANPGAVEHLSIRTRPGRSDGDSEVITDLQLHDPVRAIAELNKMERVYVETPAVHHTTFIINVISPEARTLVERVAAGERTE